MRHFTIPVYKDNKDHSFIRGGEEKDDHEATSRGLAGVSEGTTSACETVDDGNNSEHVHVGEREHKRVLVSVDVILFGIWGLLEGVVVLCEPFHIFFFGDFCDLGPSV